ncbi:L-2-amino-thiazoline-4-carboxylic acid hydrolase [Tyzzerella sp. OttesenSCG-928-J15]|nr:L-2-amino-thiazoline-4-carboxylic acid hydrolase [Tyzzerella sp. OttesenSCG-928-J15]
MESKIRKDIEVKSTDPTISAFLRSTKHRASWLGLIYDEGRKDGQEELIKKYLWDATYRYGQIVGNALKARLTVEPTDCSEFMTAFGVDTQNGAALKAKVTQRSADKADLEYHGCALLSAWVDLGLDDSACQALCRIAMNQDTAIADVLGLKFDLIETLADGADCCKCSYHR